MLPQFTIPQAATEIAAGKVIAYPTEGVFGLGCDPRQANAVAMLLALKNRPANKGLILIAHDWALLAPYVDLSRLNSGVKQQIKTLWPSFVTCVLPAAASCPAYLTGDHQGIALRVSQHPTVTALTHALGQALVSSSANPSGEAPALDHPTLERYFPTGLVGVVSGELGGEQRPSRIIDFCQGNAHVIRA